MAIRYILTEGDETLTKVCRPVTSFDDRLCQLLDDMKETLERADGVGLAAPQVGVLRRLFVMHVDDEWVDAVNPKIVQREGEQEEAEGCLSCPGVYGITKRPQIVRLQAQDRTGSYFVISADGLKARCICHETDHLDGILFRKRIIRMIDPHETKDE